MTIFLGLAISIGLCYYVSKREAQKSSLRENYLKRQQLEMGVQPVAESASNLRAGAGRGRPTQSDLIGQAQRERAAAALYQDYPDNQRRHDQHRQTPDASLVVEI
jgi:hypothetical protein